MYFAYIGLVEILVSHAYHYHGTLLSPATERIGSYFCPVSSNLDARQEAGGALAAVVRSNRIAWRLPVTEMPAFLKQQGRQRYSHRFLQLCSVDAWQKSCHAVWLRYALGRCPISSFLFK